MSEESHRVAIVTGGTRGIGYGTAKSLAKAGYNLIVGYNSNVSAAEEAKAQLERDYGVRVIPVKGDVADNSTIVQIFQCLEAEFGSKLNCVVHNAGLYVGKTTPPDSEQAVSAASVDHKILADGSFNSFEQYDYYQNVYPKCFIRLVEKAVQYMQGGGSIVATSSPGCNANQKPRIPYMLPGQAKAGLEYLVRHYAVLLAPRAITVNSVIPGFTRTGAWDAMAGPMGGVDGEMMKGLVKNSCPMNRWASVDEIGGVVAFLCSPAASYITGTAIPVDGGLHLF